MKAKSFTKSFESKNCSSFVGLQCTICRVFFTLIKESVHPWVNLILNIKVIRAIYWLKYWNQLICLKHWPPCGIWHEKGLFKSIDNATLNDFFPYDLVITKLANYVCAVSCKIMYVRNTISNIKVTLNG